MSFEHVGMYIRLLCLQHQKGHLSEKDMGYICTTYVEDVYCKFIKDSDGLYFNKRMEDETHKRVMYSESRRKNIKKRYENKRPKGATYVVHMENEDEDEDVSINSPEDVKTKKDITPAAFGEFWKLYPKRVGRGAAEKAWKKLSSPKTTLELIRAALEWQVKTEQWQKDNGQFIPMPATYLNQQRWLDERPPAQWWEKNETEGKENA